MCYGFSKALQKTEFSEFFIFRVSELFGFQVPKFFEKPGISKFAKISRKKFRNKFGSKNPVFGVNTGVSKYSKVMEYLEFFLFQISENYKKISSKLNFYLCKKLVLTRIFEFEFGMQCPRI